MKNFPIKTESGETYCISRSCAVAVFIFLRKDQELYILANKRGSGTPDFQGYWNCPCGYIDFDETGAEAACREVFEETGYVINPVYLMLHAVETDPKAYKQNITLRYTVILTPEKIKQQTRSGGEVNEVDDIQWINVKDLNQYQWAFNHDQIIESILNF